MTHKISVYRRWHPKHDGGEKDELSPDNPWFWWCSEPDRGHLFCSEGFFPTWAAAVRNARWHANNHKKGHVR